MAKFKWFSSRESVDPARWYILDFSLVFTGLAGLFIVLLREQALPQRFFLDGDFIRDVARGSASLVADDSFRAVAAVYRVLGMANSPIAASLVGYGLSLAVLVFVRMRFVRKPSFRAGALLHISILLSAVYLGFYSKDVFVLPVVFLFLAFGSSRFGSPVLIAAALVYASEFRAYWFIVTLLYVGLLLMVRLSRRPLSGLLLGALAALVIAGLALPLVLHTDATHYRDVVNAGRSGVTDAASVITPLIESASLPSGIVNLLAAFCGFVLPVPLILLGGAYYFAIAVMFMVIWIWTGSALVRAAVDESRTTMFRQRSGALLTAFLVTQALFEPDYGSALRHLTPLLGITIALVATMDRARPRVKTSPPPIRSDEKIDENV